MSPTPPTTSSFSGCTAGVIFHSRTLAGPAMFGRAMREPDWQHPCNVGVGVGDRHARFERARLENPKSPSRSRLRSMVMSAILGGGLHVQEPESFGHDADHLDRVGVREQSSSDHPAVAATGAASSRASGSPPERASAGRAGCRVGLSEEPAQLRLDAQACRTS